MERILVFSFIITENLENIVLIKVIKVAIKLQLIRELLIYAVEHLTTKNLNFKN